MTVDEYNDRRLKANRKLLEAMDSVDPNDPDAGAKYEAIAKLYHELNSDIKNELDREAKADETALEYERLDQDAKTEKVRARIDIAGKSVMAAASIFAALSQLWMFKRSTEKEHEEAILTETNQTVVRNGLSGRFWKK